MPSEHFLPILPFERISKKAGVARLSRDGAEELREIIEEIAVAIAEHSTRVALHAGRKTVTREDIEFVAGKVEPKSEIKQEIPKTPAEKVKIEPKKQEEQPKAKVYSEPSK